MICILDTNLNTLGVLDIGSPEGTPFFNDVLHISDNGTQELEFSMPYNAVVSDYMKEEAFIMYKAVDNTNYLLRIVSIDESTLEGNRVKVIKAENTAIGDLARTLIRPANYLVDTTDTVIPYNLKDYLTAILANTDWRVGVIEVDGGDTVYDMNFDSYTNAYIKVQDALTQWNCSPEFVVQMDGYKVTSKQVNFYSKLVNKEPEKIFTYSIDLIGVRRTVMGEQIINAICPIGKGDEKIPSLRFNLADFTPTIPAQYASDFAIHPSYPDVLYSKSAIQRYGSGKLLVGLLDLADLTDGADMVNKACVELASKIKPQISYDVKVETIKEWTGYEEDKQVNIGDIIIVLDDSFNPAIRVQARCIEKYSSFSTPELNYSIFGDYKEISQDPKVTFKKQTNLINNTSTLWSDASLRVQSGFVNGEDGRGISIEDLNLTYSATDGTTQKVLAIDTTQTVPVVKIASLTTSAVVLNANGNTIASDINSIPQYNPTTGEIEVSTASDLQEALRLMPKYVYRRTVVRFKANITGVFIINGFWGEGELVLAQDTYNLYGSYVFLRNTCRVGLSASTGQIIGSASNMILGNYIMTGMVNVIGCTEVEFFGLTIYGGNTTFSPYGLYVSQSNLIVTSSQLYKVNACIYAKASRISVVNCTGKARAGYGLDMDSGTFLGGSGTCPQGSAGTDLATAIRLQGGSYNGVTYTPDGGLEGSVPTQPITVRFTPSAPTSTAYSKSWKVDISNWRTDNTYVYQGQWISGIYNIGAWFFKSDVSDVLSGKTISSIKAYMSRLGDAGIQTANFRIMAHNQYAYTSTGTGSPINNFYRQDFGYPVVDTTFDLGESKWVDLTSLKAIFESTTNPARGIGLLALDGSGQHITSQAYYGRFSGDCIIEVTYT